MAEHDIGTRNSALCTDCNVQEHRNDMNTVREQTEWSSFTIILYYLASSLLVRRYTFLKYLLKG